MSMSPSLPPFPNSLLLSPLPPHHCSPETNRMASLVNSLHVQTPKAEETPLATPLPPNPSAGRAADGGRGCLGNCGAAGAVRLFWKLLWPLGFTWRPLPSAPCFSAPPPRACPEKEGNEKGRSHRLPQGKGKAEGQENRK